MKLLKKENNRSSERKDIPLYNSRIIDTYIRLIKSRYNFININELLGYAGMEPHEVEDHGHWFTQEQINRFHERLSKLTGKQDISREAGRYAASPDALGVIRHYILGFVGPARAYELIGKTASRFTKSSVFSSEKIGHNRIEITVTPNKGAREEPFQCRNRYGYFEAITKAFNYKLPKIEHPVCLFKGGDACRYIVSWEESSSALWKRARNFAALLLPVIALGYFFIDPGVTLTAIIPLAVIIFLLLHWYAGTVEMREMNTAINSLRISSEKLLEDVDNNYNNILMINEIGQALSKKTVIDDILTKVAQILEKRLDYDRGLVFLADKERTMLVFRTGFGYTDGQLKLLSMTSFHLDRPESKGSFVIAFREHRPVLVNDVDELKGTLSAHSLEFAKKMGSRAFICCPIIYEEEPIGVLAVDNLRTKRPLLQTDVNLLMGIALEVGISIRNAGLIESEVEQFKSILKILAVSIDARDPLTAGHSEKVTEYAVGISRELKMPDDYCEMIRIAALLHDYGKIGISDAILKKNGGLLTEEYEIMKTHVVKTRDILEQMHFTGIYHQVPEVAASHHEKMDGSGYPNGLKEGEIPLGGQIIAVADFFEAITSKRHYRDEMPLDIALGLLRENSGRLFEAKIVEAMLSYLDKQYQPGAGQTVL